MAVSQETTEPEVENLDDSIEEDIDNKSRRRAEDVADEEIRNAVRDVLSYCSNKSCTLGSLTARVLKELGIVARGNPRANFEKRLSRAVVRLENRKILEIYKAKNQRVRLNNEPLFKGSS